MLMRPSVRVSSVSRQSRTPWFCLVAISASARAAVRSCACKATPVRSAVRRLKVSCTSNSKTELDRLSNSKKMPGRQQLPQSKICDHQITYKMLCLLKQFYSQKKGKNWNNNFFKGAKLLFTRIKSLLGSNLKNSWSSLRNLKLHKTLFIKNFLSPGKYFQNPCKL